MEAIAVLVLSRKVGEKVVIGETVTLVVKRITGNRVILGVEAPLEMSIVRAELKQLPGADRTADLVARAVLPPSSLGRSSLPPIVPAEPKLTQPTFMPVD